MRAEGERVLESARLDADRIRADAEESAVLTAEEAKARGREMVEEALLVRTRVLEDLARKRKSARAQIARLQGGRERLLESYSIVQRTLEIHPGKIAVTDQLIGGPPREAAIVFQLAPSLTAMASGTLVIVSRGADALLRLDFPTDSIELATGEDRVDGGWASPRFGEKRPATRLVWRGPVGEGAVTTWLTPMQAKRPRNEA